MQPFCHDKSLIVYTRSSVTVGSNCEESQEGGRQKWTVTRRTIPDHAPRPTGLNQCFLLPINGLHSTVLHGRALARVVCPFRRQYPPVRFVRVRRRRTGSRKCHRLPRAGTAVEKRHPRAARFLLDESLAYGLIGQDSALDEPLTVALAAGAQPAFVQAQHVGRSGQRRVLADVGQHVDEADELP